jgi:hypothetical protein
MAATRQPTTHEATLVRTVKIATVEPERILRRIGKLGRAERTAVRKAMAGWMG